MPARLSLTKAQRDALLLLPDTEEAFVRHYSLFVCDVEMPGMNGFEFVSRTREYDYLLGIPSILVTTRAGADDRRRGAEAGARAYIVKGEFSKDSLLETVRSLVG